MKLNTQTICLGALTAALAGYVVYTRYKPTDDAALPASRSPLANQPVYRARPPTKDHTRYTPSMPHGGEPFGTKYNTVTGGPNVGEQMGVPIPAGALKYYNERYNPASRYLPPGGTGPSVNPASRYNPYDRNITIPVETMFYTEDYFKPYGPPDPRTGRDPRFFGSVDAYAPHREIDSNWEKAGILTTINPEEPEATQGMNILNLFRRPIAPVQDLWEYQVQDKNGFIIKLKERFLEDGDEIASVLGKDGLGPWKVNIFVKNKYIWV